MEHIRPLIIKYIYTAAITIIFLTYLLVPSVSLGSSMIIALFITLVLYFAGDRFLLPRFGTLAAAIANFVIAAVVLSLANAFVREPLGTGVILATAAVIGVAEWFFFRYARTEVSPAAEGGEIASFPEFLGDHETQQDNRGQQGQEGQEGGENQGHEGGENPQQ
jgi:hypothetical protein